MIIVAGGEGCVYCELAVDYLNYNNIGHEYVSYKDLSEFKEDGHLTVPQIYYRGESGNVLLLLEGGYEGLHRYGMEKLKSLPVFSQVAIEEDSGDE